MDTKAMRYAVLALAAVGVYNVLTGKTFWTIPATMKAQPVTPTTKVELMPIKFAGPVPMYTQRATIQTRPSASLPFTAKTSGE